ncbi:MAG: DUF456 domain-containing protein [Candidatus Eisenbacteria bacterium]|uniref:DUF456 domain-containing protein n=1 Tax=Eiseniibacteriota bacterium TaxID=2212470 RepID=A0A956SBW6_UNCEI|nr:DUF456 domain-containing protein [Candidatus Eisenbacteria bacterium]MCB9464932.1 DUF456 domain-containing protein [Candidatus Eisenbacteria bacterium]
MQTFADIAWLVLLDIVLLAGVLAIPLGLGGNFILLGAGLVVAIVTGFQTVGWIALVVAAVFVILGEVVEAVLGSLVAQKFGASRWGMLGAFAGGILGAIAGTAWIPLIGSLIGSFVGAAAGAVALELATGKDRDPGLRAGWGAFLGKVLSTAFKLAIGIGWAVFLVLRTH